MRIILEQSFLKSSKKLPANIKNKLSALLPLIETNPYHPLLHSKKLTGDLTGLFSFRISREWRVIFYFQDPQTLHILETKHRKDIYR